MDNVTHALFGATLGHVVGGRRLGRRALVWGAVANNLPDLDVLATIVAGPLGEWRYHRGLTHAFWFGPVAGALLGAGAWRLDRRRRPDAPPGPWVLLFVLALSLHPLMDMTTSWGTQWLAPFSRARLALDALPIIDLVYTAIVLAGAAVAVAARGWRGRRLAAAALVLSAGWMGYGRALNRRAESIAARQLEGEGVAGARVHAYPTLLQPWLRHVVARGGGEVRVGALSLWRPAPVAWARFADEPHPLIDAARRLEEVKLFEWFAMGQTLARVRATPEGPVVEVEDLRYSYIDRPDRSPWGVRAPLDATGRPRGPVTRVTHPLARRGAALRRMWRDTFGPAGAARTAA
jgi:inner membrane protein